MMVSCECSVTWKGDCHFVMPPPRNDVRGFDCLQRFGRLPHRYATHKALGGS